MAERYWIETLGCPKNQVDSDKLAGTLVADGLTVADGPEAADVVVVNTCAFIEAARQESIETVLELDDRRPAGSRLVVTGCMAERYGDELAAALPEVDAVAPFGVALLPAPGHVAPVTPAPVPVALSARPVGPPVPAFDLLELPRPPAAAPWAYVKVAEGCDRRCGFCAIPSFRGRQRSRPVDVILEEVDALAGGDARLGEVVLVAQDLASYGLDRSDRRPRDPDDPVTGRRPLVGLVQAVAARVPRTRLLYLYPSALDDALVEAVLATGVPYFDLSLQHVSRPLLRAMRRWGEGQRFLDRIAAIRRAAPDAAFRSSFIVGYPGETEADHDLLLAWLEEAQLDWAGFFPFSDEVGTHAADLPGKVPDELVAERLRECSELQDAVTARHRDALIGRELEVLVDGPGVARGVREAPEIDGIVAVPTDLDPGSFVTVRVVGAEGPDLLAEPVDRRTGHALPGDPAALAGAGPTR